MASPKGSRAQELTAQSQTVRFANAVCLAFLIVTAIPLGASFVVTPESLDDGAFSFVPDCPSKLAGETCSLCGMSHAFAAMSSARFEDAKAYNANGPWLYIICWAIAGFCALVLMVNVLKYGVGRETPRALGD